MVTFSYRTQSKNPNIASEYGWEVSILIDNWPCSIDRYLSIIGPAVSILIDTLLYQYFPSLVHYWRYSGATLRHYLDISHALICRNVKETGLWKAHARWKLRLYRLVPKNEELKKRQKSVFKRMHHFTRLELKNLYLDMKNVRICPATTWKN